MGLAAEMSSKASPGGTGSGKRRRGALKDYVANGRKTSLVGNYI